MIPGVDRERRLFERESVMCCLNTEDWKSILMIIEELFPDHRPYEMMNFYQKIISTLKAKMKEGVVERRVITDMRAHHSVYEYRRVKK